MTTKILRRMVAGLILALVCCGWNGMAQAQTATVVEDVYLENGIRKFDDKLKVQTSTDRTRVTYLKVTVVNAGTLKSAKLRLRCYLDDGSGVVRVYQGSHNNWTAASITATSAPQPLAQITQLNATYTPDNDYDLDLSSWIKQDGTYTLIVTKDELGGDVGFSSSRGPVAPKLLVEVADTVVTVPKINSFSVTPEAGASAAIISYNVSASSGTTLKEIQVWRAPDASGVPGVWKQLLNNSVDLTGQGLTTYAATTRDGVSDPGYFWYKIVVVDDDGQTAAADPIKVNPADEPGETPDDPVVPPDDPVVPPADTTVPQIHSFTVEPEAGASAAIINYSVSASDGADLQEIQVHRAPDASGVPGTWKHLLNNSVDVSALNIKSYVGGTRDGISDPGYFWYKIVVVDKAGKTAEAAPIRVNPADEPGTTPDDPVVPPDDPYVPPDDPYVPGDVAPVSQLHPSANHRYLVESDGTPVFLMGEAAWTMPENCTRADVDVYLNDRKSRGFNYVQIAAARDLDGEPTSVDLTRTMNPVNMNGHRPFQWNTNGKADVTRPIVNAGGTPTAPNDYWDHLEYIIQKAESMNMYVGILPTWSKYYINTTVTTMQLFTKDSAKIYGRFLGDRYKLYPHIIWILGGDGDISNVNTAQSMTVYRAMAEGLVQGMTGQPAVWNVASSLWDKVLITIHDRYPSHVNFNDDAWLKLNLMRGSETAGGLYERTIDSYYNSPTRPVLLGEAYYEGYVGNDSYHGPLEMRQQAYHSVLGGGLGGYAYGLAMSEVQAQDQVFKFQPGWRDRLDTAEGCNDMRHLVNLINNMGIRWWRLVPDQNIVTDGAGEGNAFKAAARTDDGAQILVYFPNVSYAKIDLRKITSHSRVEATWYDARTGATRAGGVLANTQTFSFMPPIDWVDSVLILKGTTAALQDPPATTMREFKTVGGEVVLPAENYSFTGGSGGVWGVWTPEQTIAGYLGSSYMQSSLEKPEDRSHLSFNPESANLNYVIDFKETGTYYVHLRTHADDHDENGFFATIDGQEVNYGGVSPETGLTAYFIYVRKSSIWRWWTDGGGTESHVLPVSFKVTTPGKHTFTLYRRDTGSKVDHIWLTKNNSALEAAPTTAPSVFEVK